VPHCVCPLRFKGDETPPACCLCNSQLMDVPRVGRGEPLLIIFPARRFRTHAHVSRGRRVNSPSPRSFAYYVGLWKLYLSFQILCFFDEKDFVSINQQLHKVNLLSNWNSIWLIMIKIWLRQNLIIYISQIKPVYKDYAKKQPSKKI